MKYESKYVLGDHTPEAPLKLSVSTRSCRNVSQPSTPLCPVSDSVFIAWPYALKNHYSEAESMFLSLKKGDGSASWDSHLLFLHVTSTS